MAGTVAQLLSGGDAAPAPAGAANGIPAPPPGFTLQDSAPPPPPPGFVIGAQPKDSGLLANILQGIPEGVQNSAEMIRDAILNPRALYDRVAGMADQAVGGHAASGPQSPMGLAALPADVVARKQSNSVVAATPAERILRTATAGAAGGVVNPETVGATVAQLLFGGASGLGAGAAAEAAPDNLKPAAALIGGALAPGAGMAAHPLAKAIAPFAAVVSKGAAETAAGARIANAATDPAAAAAALEQPAEIVPGSKPTTYQQTGDAGLGQLERQVATADPAAFQERAAEQNSARRAALSGVETGGDPNDLAKALKQQFEDLNAEHDAKVQAATDAAQQSANTALGPEEHADALGANLRATLSDAHEGVATQRRALYEAVDPDKSMTANTLATSQAAHAIPTQLPSTAKPLAGEPAAVFEAAQALPAIAPLQDLIGLQGRVNDAMAEAKLGGDLQAHRLLTQLRGAIEDNLSHTIAQEVANQAPRVLNGQLVGHDALVNRLVSWLQQHDGGIGAEAASQWGGHGQGFRDGQSFAGSSAYDAGASRADRVAAGRSGSPAGNPSLSPADIAAAEADLARWRQPNPQSLFGAIKKLGGLRTRDLTGARVAGPDVEAALNDVRQPGLINNQSGFAPERAAQALADAGWFGPNPGDPSAAFEAALTREGRGEKVFHPEDTFNSEAHRRLSEDIQAAGIRAGTRGAQADVQKLAAYRAAIREMRAIAERSGIAGADRMTPRELLVDLQEREAIRAEGGESRPNEYEAEFDRLSQSSRLRPTVDQATKARLDAASQFYKTEQQTYGKGPVGEVLKTNGRKDDFRLPDGQVAAKFFKPDPTGFQRMQSLVAAGGNEALATIERFAAHTLRRNALRADGTLDPARFAKWQKDYADSLRALPEETKAKFANASRASETLADVQAERTEALKVAQQGAIGRIMGLTEPEDVVKRVGQVLNGSQPIAEMKALAKATASDPVARQGLRRAIVDYITSKFIGNTEVGASGETAIKGDAYQTFIRQKRSALHLVFSPAEVRSMEAVAADLQRSARSQTTKLPGQSNTAQDTAKAMKAMAQAGQKTWLEIVGGVLGSHFGPLGTVAGIGGAAMVRALRAAGVNRIDQLVSKAMLDPALARELLKKAPQNRARWPQASAPVAVALWSADRKKDTQP